MPFTPNKISAVVLYGKKTCNRLLEILNYWQAILGDAAWKRFFILCVTAKNEEWQYPGEGEKNAGIQELLDKEIVRCMHMTLDPDQPESWKMPAQYLHAIQYQMSHGNVLAHCICDDLSCAPTAKAAVSLMESAVNFLGKGNVDCLYYLMLREGYEARQQQRLLADTIRARQPYAAVYLLSYIANDGSRLHKFELRRAAMCEILVASLGKRVYTSSMVYTLGYTSLNANNQELYCLRRNAIATRLREHYNSPITNAEAWDILTLKTGQAPNEFNPYDVHAAVKSWVESIAKKFVIKPTEREQINLRILSGITTPQEAGLYEACKLFFKANMIAEDVLSKKAENHIDMVICELRKCINMHCFPVQMLANIQEALDEIVKEKVRITRPALPQKKFLQKMDDHLNSCIREVISGVHREYVNRTAVMLAQYLAKGFERVGAAIEEVRQHNNFSDVMKAYNDSFSTGINLETNKYPKYAEAITKTINENALNLLNQKWVTSVGAVYTEDFKVDENAIRELMKSGIDELHRNMPQGYNGTFMDALKKEFDSDSAMSIFLDQYLCNDGRHMFYCPHVSSSSTMNDAVYFVDDDLQTMPWVQSQGKQAIIANSDNIERISFIQLNRDLQWMTESWTEENRYFGIQKDSVQNESGRWVTEGNRSNSSNNGTNGTAMERARVNENPCNIRLTLVQDKFMLTWNWEAGMKAVLVYINDQRPPKAIESGKYTVDGGVDVTNMVKYGRNRVVLTRLNGSAYGEMNLCGKQHHLGYRFVPSKKVGVELRIGGHIPPNADLLLGERNGDGKCCFYPVAVRGLNGKVSFDGLMLTGNYKLMVSQNNRFPVVKPEQDISLE